MRLNSLKPVLVILMVTFFASCGKTEQKVSLQEAAGTVSDPTCKRAACPVVEFTVVNGKDLSLDKVVETGDVGTDVDWSVKVSSKAVSGRIKLLVVERPLWIEKKESSEVGKVFFIGKPDEVAAKNAISILARDIGRCRALEKTPKNCESAETSFEDYDKTFRLNYTISGKGGSSIGGSTAPTGTTSPTGSNGKLTSQRGR